MAVWGAGRRKRSCAEPCTSGGVCRGVTPAVCAARHDRASRGATRRMVRSAPTSSTRRLPGESRRYVYRRQRRFPTAPPRPVSATAPCDVARAHSTPRGGVTQPAHTDCTDMGRAVDRPVTPHHHRPHPRRRTRRVRREGESKYADRPGDHHRRPLRGQVRRRPADVAGRRARSPTSATTRRRAARRRPIGGRQRWAASRAMPHLDRKLRPVSAPGEDRHGRWLSAEQEETMGGGLTTARPDGSVRTPATRPLAGAPDPSQGAMVHRRWADRPTA
jgi:hypothetical protein